MSEYCLANNTSICSNSDAGTNLLVQLLNTLILSQISLKQEYNTNRPNENLLPSYDFIVIGAGSSGSSLTAALASNPSWNILLIEAGDDPQLNSNIPFLFPTIQKTYQDWQFMTTPQENSCLAFKNQQCPLPRGKLIGGTSAINYMVYSIGNPRDYEVWEMLGNRGWRWRNVQKYFENQMQYTLKPERLNESRFDPKNCTGFSFSTNIISRIRKAILTAGQQIGYGYVNDHWEKSLGVTGFYDTLVTIRNGERNSAARAFLAPLLKQKNFRLIKNGYVTKILIDAKTKTAKGVQFLLNNQLLSIRATKEIILCAGSINTPKILMLSGIGPKQHLLNLGIQPFVNLPVGMHLSDHSGAIIPIAIHQDLPEKPLPAQDDIYQYFTKRQGILNTVLLSNIVGYLNPQNRTSRIGEIVLLSVYINKNNLQGLSGFNFSDYLNNILTETLKKTSLIFTLVSLLRPKSEGFIKLKSTNPFDSPIINTNINSNANDLQILLSGYRELQKLVQSKAMQAEGAKLVKLDFDECKQYEYNSDEYCICLIKHVSTPTYHTVGTARMGISNDSVVDPRLRVHGIKRLRVADGSIMPKIVGGNTNAPIIMIGQKAGDLIKEDWLN